MRRQKKIVTPVSPIDLQEVRRMSGMCLHYAGKSVDREDVWYGIDGEGYPIVRIGHPWDLSQGVWDAWGGDLAKTTEDGVDEAHGFARELIEKGYRRLILD